MNTTKITVAFGIIVLAISAALANTSPKGIITTVFITVANSCTGHSFGVTGSRYTTGGSGCQATIKTSGCTNRKLWAVCTAGVPSKPVYFHH